MDEFKWEKPASPNESKTENPAFPVFGRTSTGHDPTLCSDSNDRWWCSDSNEIGINHSEVAESNNEEAKNKKKVKCMFFI